LALSVAGGDHYLYAGFQNYANVQRYALPGLTPDLLIPLGIDNGYLGWSPGSVEGCDFAVSLIIDGHTWACTTIAVTQGNTALESVGCGSAVVAGASGGLSYLSPKPTSNLATNDIIRARLSTRARMLLS
jgi:hypothetical protein